MRIRKLWLKDGRGKRFELDGSDGVYVSELAGLGFSLSPNWGDLGNGFFKALDSTQEPQRNVTFTVTFTRAPYATFQRFVDFVSTGNVSLCYSPFEGAEYIRDVSISSVSKSELNAVGWLECSCSLLCLTPWYMPSFTSLTLESDGDEDVRRYPYTYTPGLRFGSESAAALSGVIMPAGHIPGALQILYTGGIVNPRISLVGNQTGKTYGVCSLKAEIPADHYLLLTTTPNGSSVGMIAPDLTATELLNALDLSFDPYPRIPVDEPCTLRIESDSEIPGVATVQVYYFFRSV